MASPGLPALLAAQVEGARPAPGPTADPTPHPAHVSGESDHEPDPAQRERFTASSEARVAEQSTLHGKAPRILSELRLLGYEVSERTVAKYMGRRPTPGPQTWRTFLKNHSRDIAAIDFFLVRRSSSTKAEPCLRRASASCYCFIVISHQRREVIHFHVAEHPTAQWTAQQIVGAFPYDTVPRYLMRDRDGIYGDYFRQRISNMGTTEVMISPRSPWQSDYVAYCTSSVRSGWTSLRVGFP